MVYIGHCTKGIALYIRIVSHTTTTILNLRKFLNDLPLIRRNGLHRKATHFQ
jgi:hypothetical protein